jgi:hypothetical protein
MLWGHKYMSIPTKSHKRRPGRHPTEYSTLENTLIGICPRDHLHVRIYNTVADATKINNPKVDSTIEYNHACMRCPWKRRQTRDGQWTQNNLVVPQKLAQIRPRQYKHDSIESSIHKSQQGGGNKSQIYPLTVKETVNAYHAHATLKRLL